MNGNIKTNILFDITYIYANNNHGFIIINTITPIT